MSARISSLAASNKGAHPLSKGAPPEAPAANAITSEMKLNVWIPKGDRHSAHITHWPPVAPGMFLNLNIYVSREFNPHLLFNFKNHVWKRWLSCYLRLGRGDGYRTYFFLSFYLAHLPSIHPSIHPSILSLSIYGALSMLLWPSGSISLVFSGIMS